MHVHQGAGTKMGRFGAKNRWDGGRVQRRLRVCPHYVLQFVGIDSIHQIQLVGDRHKTVLPQLAQFYNCVKHLRLLICLQAYTQSFQRGPVLWEHPRITGNNHSSFNNFFSYNIFFLSGTVLLGYNYFFLLR